MQLYKHESSYVFHQQLLPTRSCRVQCIGEEHTFLSGAYPDKHTTNNSCHVKVTKRTNWKWKNCRYSIWWWN